MQQAWHRKNVCAGAPNSGRLVSSHVSHDPRNRSRLVSAPGRTACPDNWSLPVGRSPARNRGRRCSCAGSDVPGATTGSTPRKRLPAAAQVSRFRSQRVRCRWNQRWRNLADLRSDFARRTVRAADKLFNDRFRRRSRLNGRSSSFCGLYRFHGFHRYRSQC
jgi:hypothetical protein